MTANHLMRETTHRRWSSPSPDWTAEPQHANSGATRGCQAAAPRYGHQFGQVRVTPSPLLVQREGENDVCIEGVPDPEMSGINPFAPTLPAPADPFAPTEFPEYPIDPVNPTIPKAPPVPNIPEPPPGGFPEAPPTPASPPGGGGGFWGTLGAGIIGIGSSLFDFFPPIPKNFLEDPFGTGRPDIA